MSLKQYINFKTDYVVGLKPIETYAIWSKLIRSTETVMQFLI